jgi:hypothetical protein
MPSTRLASRITVRRASAAALYLRVLLAKERLRERQSEPDQKPVRSSLGISRQNDSDAGGLTAESQTGRARGGRARRGYEARRV